MLKNRFNYWTCSKFADFIRGTEKPFALEWKEWDEWKDTQKKERPIRFWLSDTLLGYMQDVIYFPYDIYSHCKHYIRNRWIDKRHYLKTGLKPGHYYEFDERILHGLFNELIDYVEIECAHLSFLNEDKKYTVKNGRCIEAAYDYFEWSNNLKEEGEDNNETLSEQAIQSRELQELYEWWKLKRPLRKDPDELSGWKTHCEISEDHLFDNDISEEKIEEVNQILTMLDNIEQSQYDEDTDMLIRLIKLRRHLWI
jgi:hypothetical protein